METRLAHTIFPWTISALGTLVLAVGCALTLPDTSRTGTIHNVTIEEEVVPAEIKGSVGDEVRWVNHRIAPVRVVFLDGDLDDVSCQKGFRSIAALKESASIAPGQTASICFKKPGYYKYTVRMTASVPGGEVIRSGTVLIGKSPGA